jgi:YD repeat-containing protein
MGGSFSRVNPTAAFTTTTDNANRLASFNGATLQYDANGNLTGDGTNTYTWNARNQLIQISGATTATFTYDAIGRRQSKTINGVTSNYVYDGANIVGDTGSGTTYLTGLGIDETLAMESGSGATA